MTRHLSRLLNAKEPQFSQTLAKLEVANGHACQDIFLSEDVRRSVRDKLGLLNLDPDDTTAEELYWVLQEKLKQDEIKLVKHLRTISASHVSAEGSLSEGIAYAVKQSASGLKSYGIKPAVLRRILLKLPPKKTMKALGYRSVSSMLKHEQAGLIVTAAAAWEPLTWLRQYHQALKRLKPSDCAELKLSVLAAGSAKWSDIGAELKRFSRKTVLISRESASMLILPVNSARPKPGLTTATLVSALSSVNALLVGGSYLQLSQLSKDFGERLLQAAESEPRLGLEFLNSPVSWETVQRLIHHLKAPIEQIIEAPIDFHAASGWRPVEDLVDEIDSDMKFWRDSGHLCSPGSDQPVSLNLMDNAYNLLNRKPFAERVARYGQNALWQELVLRYIRPELLSEALTRELQPKLASETVSV